MDKLINRIDADNMVGEFLEMLEAEIGVWGGGVPDDGKFEGFIDAAWGEYNSGSIDCQEAVARIQDYDRLKLV